MKALLNIIAGWCILSCNSSTAPTQSSSPSRLDPSEVFVTSYFPEDSNARPAAAPKEVLINVKTTDRISSNHYSDMVVDSRGDAYIACFEKKEDGQDYILIIKISQQGRLIWESGHNLKGRATAISIDKEDHVWVLGSLDEGLPDQSNIGLEQKQGGVFIARFSPEGKCTRLICSTGSGRAFNIHINPYNEILVSGHMGKELTFGGISRQNQTGEEEHFIARFDHLGQCIWIKPLNASISRIRSDSSGDFYLCGSFHEQLIWEQDTLFTESRYDDDGFLMKISRNDQNHWIRAFGQKGIIETGYATRETAADMVINSNNEILLSAMMDLFEQDLPEKERVKASDLSLLQYDTQGNLVDQVLLAKHLSKRSSSCLTQDREGHIWVSGHAQPNSLINEKPLQTEQDQQTFLLELSPGKNLEQIIFPQHGSNMSFRAAYSRGKRVYFSGHFQSTLSINGQTIRNDGAHALFFYNKPIKK